MAKRRTVPRAGRDVSKRGNFLLTLRPTERDRWHAAAARDEMKLSPFIRLAVEERILRRDLGLATDGGPPDPKELRRAYERLIGLSADEVRLEWRDALAAGEDW